MMISDCLHEVQQQIQKLLEEYPEIYQDVEADILQWIQHTKRLRDTIGQFGEVLDRENLIEMHKPHESSSPAIATPEAESASQEQQTAPKTPMVCPKCSKEMQATTNLEPAPQPGHVTIVSQYDCPHCGYEKSEQVYLPKEIALQEYNLEQLMKGI